MLNVLNQALIIHNSHMRNKQCKAKDFYQNLDEIVGWIAYEIKKDLSMLHAELGMVNGFRDLTTCDDTRHFGTI